MHNFLEKRKENNLQRKSLVLIKQHLSGEFKRVKVVNMNNIAELSDMILQCVYTVIKARIDESDFIHIKIEDMNGYLFEGFTQNYKWFCETFSL